MRSCQGCGEPRRFEADPKDPDHLLLMVRHKRGCSWSPLIAPAFEEWIMDRVPRTDTLEGERPTSAKP